jgi:hypothetical protein
MLRSVHHAPFPCCAWAGAAPNIVPTARTKANAVIVFMGRSSIASETIGANANSSRWALLLGSRWDSHYVDIEPTIAIY